MTGIYQKLRESYNAKRAIMTPEQKRRSFQRSQYSAKQTAKTTLFTSVFGLSEYVYPMTLTGKRKVVTGFDAMAIEQQPLLWNITCYALCKDTVGNNYLKAMEIYLKEPVKQSAIHKSLSHAHYDWMKESVNMKHMLTLAWIATTATPPAEELAMKIFNDLNVFESFDLCTTTDDGSYCINLKEQNK